MQTVLFWAFTEMTHIPDDHFYQEKLLISHREIPVLRYLTQPMESGRWDLLGPVVSGDCQELWQ